MKPRSRQGGVVAGALAFVALAFVALGFVALMPAGCNKSTTTIQGAPPTTFGVNVTVNAKALSATQLAMVKVGSLIVTSLATSEAQQFSVVPQISSGQLTFQYLPKAGTTGALNFEFDALDAAGELWGTGKAGPVTLTASAAVPVTITLAASAGTSKGLGAKCTTATECGSGFCTDGVCCESACKDTCASCALINTTGLCTGYAANTDPEKECGGFSLTTGTGGTGGAGGKGGAGGAKTDAAVPMDASASDAEVINPPDGGIVATASTCGGTCNGMKACAFASPGASCGEPFCNTRKDLANLICDGKGTCYIGLDDCSNGYACSSQTSACRTTCSANLDCLASYYCNGTTNACAATKSDGLTCATDAECTSNHCVIANGTGVCCNTACDSPNSCNNSGSAGKCQCPNVTCTAGVACQIFYQDADGDGYGNRNGVLGTTAKAGCAGAPPAGFVADNTDCDDGDANAFPGQTAYFPTPSKGIGTFDYNCDGTSEKGIPEYPSASCTFCPSACGTNGCSAAASGSCGSANESASLSCGREGGICPPVIVLQPTMSSEIASSIGLPPPITFYGACCGCNAADHAGFTTTVACGVSSNTYTTCGTCGSSSGTGIGSTGGTSTTVVTKVQPCH
ncbi:MAG TPA: hypothetical protein VH853_01535 [Polyangia bacterium]|jgi:hypothetical protein|nr:hypothetical protein [Polyangia bacterium]